MSDALAPAQPAAISEAFQDAGLRERMSSPNYLVREQAQQEWSSRFQAAYGEVTPEPTPSQALGLPAEMLRQAAPLDVAGDAIPPAAEHYFTPMCFREDPGVMAEFRGWCATAELTQSEAVELASALDEFDRTGSDITQWPPHLREAREKLLEQGFMADPQGRQTLARARAVFGELRRSHPGLAALFDQTGASSDPDVIRALARLSRG
jgi:hypothetical protein